MVIKEISVKQLSSIINEHFIEHINLKQVHNYLQEVGITTPANYDKKNLSKQLATVVFNMLLKDFSFVLSKNTQFLNVTELTNTKDNGLIATMLYRLANFFYYASFSNTETKNASISLMQQATKITTINISPQTIILEGLNLFNASHIIIGSSSTIGQNCTIGSGAILGSKNTFTKANESIHPTIKNGVIIGSKAKILGNIVIGNGVIISPHAVVLEDIEDNQKVIITNQLQLTKNSNLSTLPSQQLTIYGVVPKFKNSITILGESFYNPTVLIKIKGNKELDYQITYWDKNKIIIKFKSCTPYKEQTLNGAKVIVLSNSNKVVILNSIGLVKALTNLTD